MSVISWVLIYVPGWVYSVLQCTASQVRHSPLVTTVSSPRSLTPAHTLLPHPGAHWWPGDADSVWSQAEPGLSLTHNCDQFLTAVPAQRTSSWHSSDHSHHQWSSFMIIIISDGSPVSAQISVVPAQVLPGDRGSGSWPGSSEGSHVRIRRISWQHQSSQPPQTSSSREQRLWHWMSQGRVSFLRPLGFSFHFFVYDLKVFFKSSKNIYGPNFYYWGSINL